MLGVGVAVCIGGFLAGKADDSRRLKRIERAQHDLDALDKELDAKMLQSRMAKYSLDPSEIDKIDKVIVQKLKDLKIGEYAEKSFKAFAAHQEAINSWWTLSLVSQSSHVDSEL